MKIARKFNALGLTGFLVAASVHAATQDVEDMAPVIKELPSMEKKTPAKKPEATAKPAKHGGTHIEMVELPSGVFMGKYEVTQAQWKEIMGKNPATFTNCGDSCPVEAISWDQVQEFLKKLNSQTGKSYRLPSQAEWFGACEAENKDNEYCGSDNIEEVAWYNGNSAEHTHPVGLKHPNAYGLHDMSGNVSEWTNSCNEGKCSRRIYLGGSWLDTPANVRAANTPKYDTTFRGYLFLGFRLALDP